MDTYIYILINLVGLLFDLFGFIGIYYTKLTDISKINDYGIRASIKYNHSNPNSIEISEKIIRLVNDKLNQINKDHKLQDRKTVKFFGIVVLGVALQISSLFVYLYQNL